MYKCSDIKGSLYNNFIEYAVNKSKRFKLVLHEHFDNKNSVFDILNSLEKYMIKKEQTNKMPGTICVIDDEDCFTLPWVYEFQCTQEVIEILQNAADSFVDWLNPNLPEDLSFYNEKGDAWLVNVTHEDMLSFNVGEEILDISQKIPGFTYNHDFDGFDGFNECTDKIINHVKDTNSSKLFLNNYKYESLPADIKELSGLKYLLIKILVLKSLPKEIRYLTNLESLIILCPNFEVLPSDIEGLISLKELHIVSHKLNNIPKTIGKLSNLIKIHIDSSDYSTCDNFLTDLPAKSKLSSIPKEFYELKNLKEITITSTSLEYLPDNIGNLTKLEVLNICENKLKSLPDSFSNLVNLKYINIYDNDF